MPHPPATLPEALQDEGLDSAAFFYVNRNQRYRLNPAHSPFGANFPHPTCGAVCEAVRLNISRSLQWKVGADYPLL
jgi:hypothetical protein